MSRLGRYQLERSALATVERWTTTGINAIRHRPALLVLLGSAGIIGLLVVLLGPIAQWATPVAGLQGKDLADARNSTRQTLLAAVGGTVVFMGLAFTVRTYYLTRRGQLTDRYATAIGQLASDKITERLGGIYALEHIMIESARDHDTIVEVLAAFIRESAPANADNKESERTSTNTERSTHGATWVPRPTTDVRAALTVLRRRPHRAERHRIGLERTNLGGADLSYAPLRHVDLHGAKLRLTWLVGAELDGANLNGAHLTSYLMDANLEGAYLQEAQMQGAQLQRANLRGTQLRGAQLHNANLRDANLQNANLAAANLQGADLDGTLLQGANLATNGLGHPECTQGLTIEQLAKAILDDTTVLPHELREALTSHGHQQDHKGPSLRI